MILTTALLECPSCGHLSALGTTRCPDCRRRLPVPHESEKEFQARVIALATALGYRVYHTFDSRRSESGFPDLTLVGTGPRAGRLLFIELKTDTGRVSDSQNEWLQALSLCAGVDVAVWRPAGWDDIVEILEREGR